jgi:chaperonin GroES
MSINVKPLHDKVIVKLIEAETKTAGGIIIPDTAKQKPQEAIVAAVGAGKKTEDGKVIALDVKVGDRVYFAKWGGTEIKVDGEDYIILSESDILAVNLAAKS